jgi:aminoglycoside phosphotransferase (APT) family kinase protein
MAGPEPLRATEVSGIVVAYLPGYRVDSIVPAGEGQDHRAYEVNGELIVRFSRHPDPVRLRNEARLLRAVARVSPLPVPEPVFTVAEQGCLAYVKLPGSPVLQIPRHRRRARDASIGAVLGGLLRALHAVPVDRLAGLVDTDDPPLAEWLREATETYLTVAGQIPTVHHRSVVAFLDTPPPDAGYTPVFSHNDLGIEHVLVDPVSWAVTGILDWSDAAIVDPAVDFGLIHRDLGPAATGAALDGYRGTPDDVAALTERAVFYARCSVFEDLAYGIETRRDSYVDKSLAAMPWLFPA